MGKARKRTTATIGIMTVFAVIVLMFYYYWTNRVTPIEDSSIENLTENEKILAEDFENNYPATPREVVKSFARIMRALYSEPKDEELEPLAVKIRELYDEEFLNNNPMETYLTNLKTDIASWKDKNRTIANYLLSNEDLEQESVIDGINYSVNYVTYTIMENRKFTETWKVLLRQDEDERWKILGWQFVPEN